MAPKSKKTTTETTTETETTETTETTTTTEVEIDRTDFPTWRQSKQLLKWQLGAVGIKVDLDVEITDTDRDLARKEIASWDGDTTREDGVEGLAFWFAASYELGSRCVSKKSVMTATDYMRRTERFGRSSDRAKEFAKRLGLSEGSWEFTGTETAKLGGLTPRAVPGTGTVPRLTTQAVVTATPSLDPIALAEKVTKLRGFGLSDEQIREIMAMAQ